MRRAILGLLVLSFVLLSTSSARADPLSARVRKAVKKGSKWVADTQHRDGHWDASSGQYPVAMTALGGMSLLMEGSTVREGKYSENIRRAVDWLVRRAQPNGLIGDTDNPSERSRYMYGHGFSLLFLSSAYGNETDLERRKKLEGILTRAAKFCHDAQTNRGGWGYVTARDGNGFDEGSVTITQVQALRAARNAGIEVPKEAINMSIKYLNDSTTANGGIMYSLANGGGSGRPALTAAAISCGFSAGDYNSPLVKKWFKFCESRVPLSRSMGHDDYTHYYYSQAMYMLGDKKWKEMFPTDKEGLSWSKYKDARFDYILKQQNSNGSWTGNIGPIYRTAINLTILQLEKGILPIYQR